ncbi:MAG TPA: BTAD domain-containing putative transcriptional regulator [Fimbriimonadaceae bacterium]|nr:BTAD domain-containing putative transcriptional regulator [Fimbriimonadaceae bacterium]
MRRRAYAMSHDPSQSADSHGVRWALQLLGGLRCCLGEVVVEKFATRKAALLLIRLGLAGSVSIQRDELAILLWPDEPADVSRPRLRQAVISLKRSFSEAEPFPIDAQKNELRIEVGEVAIDYHEFEGLVRGGRDEEAVAMYRPLLPGWTDAWIAPYRKRAEGLFVQTVLRLAETSPAERAVRLLAEACAVHPLNEALLSAYMIRLNRSGEQARSLQAYESYVAMLDAQKGIGPGSALRKLAEEATSARAQGESIPIRIEAAALPNPLTRLFGRTAAIERLGAFVHGGRRLVTLTGIGGIGKTRVALEFCGRSAGFDPVAFVPFGQVSGDAFVFEAIHAALGIPATFRSDSTATLAKALSRRRALLVFDGVEHLLPDLAKAVAGLLAACPTLTILATSRVPLGIAGEQVMPVGPLADDAEAAEMFLDRASLLTGVAPSGAETFAAAQRIAKTLDGIPLAIELAAAQTGLFSLAQIEERLADRLSFLKGGLDVVEPRHERLDEVLAWSIESLPPETRAVFATLSVFHGTFTVDSASAVYGNSVETHIEMLRRRALVVDAPSHGPRRFRMLHTVREAAFRLLEPSAAAAYRRELRKFLLEFCNEQAKRFDSAETSGLAHRILAEEFENVRDCMATALDEDLEMGLELAIKHAVIGAGMGNIGDCRHWLEAYLLGRTWPASRLAARGFFQLAIAVGFFGLEELELEYLRRCASVAEECGATDLTALAGTNMALILLWSDRLRMAVVEAERCLLLWPPDSYTRTLVESVMVQVRGLLGEPDWARSRMEQILAEAQKTDSNAWFLSESCFGVARLALDAGDYDHALEAARNGHDVLVAGGYAAMASNVLSFIAHILVAAGRAEEAWPLVHELDELGRDRGLPAASVYSDYLTGLLTDDAKRLLEAARGAVAMTHWSLAAKAFQALAGVTPDRRDACRFLAGARALREEHGVDLSVSDTRNWECATIAAGYAGQPPPPLDDLLEG